MNFGDEGEQDDELLLTEGVEEQEGAGQPEAEDRKPEDEDEELVLAIEGEDEPDGDKLVRLLRDQLRSAKGELAKLKRNDPVDTVEVGPRPKLEDFDWIEDKYGEALDAWYARKAQAERAESEKSSQAEIQQRDFERLKARHEARAAVLKIPDFETRQQAVIDALGPEFAGAALVVADDSAKLVGALGDNPAALARIQEEPNPLLKLKMLIKLESKIVTNKRKPPEPEASSIQRGSAPLAAGAADKKLAALEKKARETGDRTELSRYRRSLKQKVA